MTLRTRSLPRRLTEGIEMGGAGLDEALFSLEHVLGADGLSDGNAQLVNDLSS